MNDIYSGLAGGLAVALIICYKEYREYQTKKLIALPENDPLVIEARSFAKINKISQNFYVIASYDVDFAFTAKLVPTLFTNFIHISKIYTSKTGVTDIIRNLDSIDMITDECKIRIKSDNFENRDQTLFEVKFLINNIIKCKNFVLGHELGHIKESFFTRFFTRLHKREHNCDLISAKIYRDQAFQLFNHLQQLHEIYKIEINNRTHPSCQSRIDYLNRFLTTN